MTEASQRHEFATEVQDLLQLMVHSLYSNKDIFLRELISNSSDALDKLRFESLTDKSLAPEEELHIRLDAKSDDDGHRTLTVSDNGIGMSRQEVIQHIGTIARSGTKEFLANAQAQSKESSGSAPEDLIGQFGVGFYSTFMVADRVTIVTRRAGEEGATRWESTGDGGYEIGDAQRPESGTTITLRLKNVDEDDGIHDYVDTWVLKGIVKKHSDFVAYPIRMRVERQEPVLDEDGKPVEGAVPKITYEDETLNSVQALWTRPKNEVKDEEYKEFYKHISGDWNEPLEIISAKMEGTFEALALLFVPKQAPFDLYHRERTSKGLQLYVKRVFIMEDQDVLLPEWLRFIKGVVDSEDLSLNVSREILQQDRQVKALRKFLIKKVLDSLDGMKKNQTERYQGFWAEFGRVLKEGLIGFGDHRDRLLDLLLCSTTHDKNLASLSDYVERMNDDQETIYFLTGPSLEAVQKSPHLEAFEAKGLEVLLFTDEIDEVWVQNNVEFQGKKLQSIGKGEIELGSEEEKKEAEKKKDELERDTFKDLLLTLRSVLQEEVKEVRLSGRLTESAACLVGDADDMSPQMEDIMRRLGQSVPQSKRILELNPDHPLIERLAAIHKAKKGSMALEQYAKLLYGQAILAEGGSLSDPAGYSRLVMDMMVKAAGETEPATAEA